MSEPGLTAPRGGWNAPQRLLIWMLSDPVHRGACPVDGLASGGWDAFADLAILRHRVHPWIAGCLADLPFAVPGGTAERLAAAARGTAFDALRQKAAATRIGAALDALGIPNLVLKGWPVAEALYGSAALRQSKDLDILVRPEQREAAAAALRRLGFSGAIPDDVGAADRESGFTDAEGLIVELHWRAFTFRSLPGLEAGSAAPPGPALMLATLALHAAESGFCRLKWLQDIARALATLPPAEIGAALEIGRRGAAERAVALSFRLAHRLLAAPLPVALPEEGLRDRVLARWALAAIASPVTVARDRPERLRQILARMLAGDGFGGVAAGLRAEVAARLRPRRAPLACVV